MPSAGPFETAFIESTSTEHSVMSTEDKSSEFVMLQISIDTVAQSCASPRTTHSMEFSASRTTVSSLIPEKPMNEPVGAGDGAGDGTGDGAGVGWIVGTEDGSALGEGVGAVVGAGIGTAFGTGVGTALGADIGAALGEGIGILFEGGVGMALGSGSVHSVEVMLGSHALPVEKSQQIAPSSSSSSSSSSSDVGIYLAITEQRMKENDSDYASSPTAPPPPPPPPIRAVFCTASSYFQIHFFVIRLSAYVQTQERTRRVRWQRAAIMGPRLFRVY